MYRTQPQDHIYDLCHLRFQREATQEPHTSQAHFIKHLNWVCRSAFWGVGFKYTPATNQSFLGRGHMSSPPQPSSHPAIRTPATHGPQWCRTPSCGSSRKCSTSSSKRPATCESKEVAHKSGNPKMACPGFFGTFWNQRLKPAVFWWF